MRTNFRDRGRGRGQIAEAKAEAEANFPRPKITFIIIIMFTTQTVQYINVSSLLSFKYYHESELKHIMELVI